MAAFKGFFFVIVLICFANAESNNTQNIVDIVDFRFDKIRDNINSDISSIKIELEKIKAVQDETIEKEILNIDRSIESMEDKLSKNINDRKAFEKEFHEDVRKYNQTIVRQDKKIDELSMSFSFWAVGFLLVGLLTAIVSFFIARIYSRKAREDAAKEVDYMLNRWIKQKDEEFEQREVRENKKEHELTKQIEFWKSRYEELKFNDDHFLAEFKKWAKNIEDKEIKNRVKKYIKKLKKENESKEE